MLKKHLGFSLNIVALIFFFPGIYLNMFRLDMEMAASISGSSLLANLINKELSIINTVNELWQDQRLFVAALIFIFSICIPLIKTSLLSIAYLTKKQKWETKLVKFVTNIGKWSMADVFVVAVFLAILSTNHGDTNNAQQVSIFGFKIMIEISTQTMSNVGLGFYYFCAYCFVSMLGSQLYLSHIQQTNAEQNVTMRN